MGSGPADTESLQASRAGERLDTEGDDWTGGPAAKGVAGREESGESEAEGLGGLVGGAGAGQLQSGAAEQLPGAAGAEFRPAAQPAAAHEGRTAEMPKDERVLKDEL